MFLTEGSTPRRGRRVLPVTLGHHHKPFGSARTARALRALDLAGALHALWRTERRGAREKGVDQDRRTVRDSTHQRVLRRQRGLERVRVLHNVSRAAREGTCPAGIESSSRRSGDAPKNCRNRLPRGLVQIGDVPATQETHPDWPRAPGSHTDRLRHAWFWEGGRNRAFLN